MAHPVHFLLSPAHCGGKRAAILMSAEAEFPLARRLRDEGLPLGEAFSFLSGLYFRGKLAYAERFGGAGGGTVRVISANSGLLPPETVVTVDDLLAFGRHDIDPDDARYREPLARDAERLAATRADVVLLGSIATGKYVDVLASILGPRLLFPREFVGRGDMSRGALMLRAARDGEELEYVSIEGSRRSTAAISPRGARAAR